MTRKLSMKSRQQTTVVSKRTLDETQRTQETCAGSAVKGYNGEGPSNLDSRICHGLFNCVDTDSIYCIDSSNNSSRYDDRT